MHCAAVFIRSAALGWHYRRLDGLKTGLSFAVFELQVQDLVFGRGFSALSLSLAQLENGYLATP